MTTKITLVLRIWNRHMEFLGQVMKGEGLENLILIVREIEIRIGSDSST